MIRASGDVIRSQPEPTIEDVVFSPTGHFVADLDHGGRYRMWSSIEGAPLYTAPDGWGIVGINNDGTVVLIHRRRGLAGPGEAGTRLVSVVDGATIAEIDAGTWVPGVEFSPNGAYVVTNNNGSAGPSSSHRIWSTADGRLAAEFGSTEDAGFPGGWWFEFTADGSKLVVGGGDGIVRVFDFDQLVS